MDLTLTPPEKAFRDELRLWLEQNIPEPYLGNTHLDNPGYVEYLRHWQGKLFQAGWNGLTWPEAYGGRGATPIEQGLLLEEMARANAPEIIGGLGIALIGPTIIALGTEEQKRRYLRPMLAGEEIWCQGFSEPSAGSDLGSLATRAVREGDSFAVNGQKIWTSYAQASDFCFLLVRTDSKAPKHKGITCLLVDMKSEGVSVKPLRMMSGDAGFNEIFFTNVRVPADQVLGKVNDGWRVAITALMYERANLGSGIWIGMSRFLRHLIQATRRLPGGSSSPTEDRLTRQKIAQAHIDLEVFRMTLARNLSRLSRGAIPGPEGSILKLLYSETEQRTSRAAMEILGPYGQLTEGDHGLFSYTYLRSRGRTSEGGTSEILRNIIAERVLGLPKSY